MFSGDFEALLWKIDILAGPATPGGPEGSWPLHFFENLGKKYSETKELLKKQCFGPTFSWPLHFQTRVAGPVWITFGTQNGRF